MHNYTKLDFQGRQAPPQSSVIVAELCHQVFHSSSSSSKLNFIYLDFKSSTNVTSLAYL